VVGKNIPPWFMVRWPNSLLSLHLTRVSAVDQPAGTGFSYTSSEHFIRTPDEVCCRYGPGYCF
jgi:hypothetical protein